MRRTQLDGRFAPVEVAAPAEWIVSSGLVPYEAAVAWMERRVDAISAGAADECVWLLEHPALFTAGTSARPADLLTPDLPVHQTGRGGQYTYHGPAQRVAYVMLDLKRRDPDVRRFVAALERWIVATLARVDVTAFGREDRVGVWVPRHQAETPGEDKIAAIGVRLRRWVSFHGVAINVAPDLQHFKRIVPCGIADAAYGVTSLEALGRPMSLPAFDRDLRESFEVIFGPTRDSPAPAL